MLFIGKPKGRLRMISISAYIYVCMCVCVSFCASLNHGRLCVFVCVARSYSAS